MDDFYNEMKDILEPIFKPSDSDLESSKSSSYFPNIYAEALVPINPYRWPAFGAGSAMASDMPDIGDKIKTPFDNLLVAKEYLETSQSDIQWRDRFWQLTEDTVSINLVEIVIFGRPVILDASNGFDIFSAGKADPIADSEAIIKDLLKK